MSQGISSRDTVLEIPEYVGLDDENGRIRV